MSNRPRNTKKGPTAISADTAPENATTAPTDVETPGTIIKDSHLNEFESALTAHLKADTTDLSTKQQALLQDTLNTFIASVMEKMRETLTDTTVGTVTTAARLGEVEPVDRSLAAAVITMRGQANALAKQVDQRRKDTRATLPTTLRTRYETRAHKAKQLVSGLDAEVAKVEPVPGLNMGLRVAREVIADVTESYVDQQQRIDGVIRDASDTVAVAESMRRVGPTTKRMDKLMLTDVTSKKA